MTELKIELNALADAVKTVPHPALIYAGRYFIVEYDRDRLPDWVAALANGNAATFEDLVDVVLAEMEE